MPRLLEEYAKYVPTQCLGGTCSLLLLGDFCGGPKLPRCDADDPLEVKTELALV
jgi:hypothetical protein